MAPFHSHSFNLMAVWHPTMISEATMLFSADQPEVSSATPRQLPPSQSLDLTWAERPPTFPATMECTNTHWKQPRQAGVAIQAPQLDIHTVAAGGGSRLFWQHSMLVVGRRVVRGGPSGTSVLSEEWIFGRHGRQCCPGTYLAQGISSHFWS